MLETLKNAFRNKDIRKKILMTLLLLLLFRIGCYIPVPGLDRKVFVDAVGSNDFLALMSGITGNALSNGTLFALGISPYINSTIIIQLRRHSRFGTSFQARRRGQKEDHEYHPYSHDHSGNHSVGRYYRSFR